MRKILASYIISALIIGILPSAHAQSGYYLVSAYYSPEVGQDFYLNGTYEDEVRMNGEGKHTASGEAVRIGAVAAPRTIPFGTRVAIDQEVTLRGQKVRIVFQGTVMDRGGAITTSSKLPRLDIYMGSGQAGLCRAINFGVQTVYAGLESTDSPDAFNIEKIPSDCKNPSGVVVKPQTAAFDPFTTTLSSTSSTENIKVVQRLFQRVNALKGEVDGLFDQEMRETIYEFQKKYLLVTSWSDAGAGNYGPRTRATLKSLLDGTYQPPETSAPSTSPTPPTPPASVTPSPADPSLPEQGTSVFDRQVFDGSKSEDIRALQNILRDLGYFKHAVDGLYNKRLTDAIYTFQLAKGIVNSEDDIGAGYYGPVTRSTLEEAYSAWQKNQTRRAELQKQLENAQAVRAQALAEKKVWFTDMVNRIPALKVGQVHPEIRTLQILLKDLGYLDHKDTAIFGDLTRYALARYQVDLGMIDSVSSPYAGVLGRRTREAIAADLLKRWEKTDTTGKADIDKITAELKSL